jgi:hypothetical protein
MGRSSASGLADRDNSAKVAVYQEAEANDRHWPRVCATQWA